MSFSPFSLLLSFANSRQIGGSGNQPYASAPREIRPRPVHHDQQAIAEADQVKDMYDEPQKPSYGAGEVRFPNLGHCG